VDELWRVTRYSFFCHGQLSSERSNSCGRSAVEGAKCGRIGRCPWHSYHNYMLLLVRTAKRFPPPSLISVCYNLLERSMAPRSPTLSFSRHVEAWVAQLGFQPAQHGGARLNLCSNHADPAHKGFRQPNHRFEDVILCERFPEKDEFYKRLIHELWTCIPIFTGFTESGYLHNFIVVDWHG
jgi:hypothetical protein